MRTRKLRYSEETLVRLLQERNPKGAAALYDMYSAVLFGTISRIIPDEVQAQDVLQESFLRIWQSFEYYQKDKGRLFTWMVNVARNLAIDCLRSKSYRKNQQTIGLDGCEQMEVTAMDCDVRIDQGLIRGGVCKLRNKEKDVVELIYYKGYSHAEVAQVLGVPLGTVKTRLMTALKRLRTFYVLNDFALAS